MTIGSMLFSSVSCFVDEFALFSSGKVSPHHAWLTKVVPSAFYSFGINLLSIVETLCTAERGEGYLHLAQRRQERRFHYFWFLVTILPHGRGKCTLSKSVVFSI